MGETKNQGEFKKRCVNLQKTFCVHTPVEDEHGEITQKIHESYRNPTHEEIKNVLDEAKKEIFAFLGSAHYSSSKSRFIKSITDDESLVLALEKWFGDSE